jgi:putative sigma-54 modulation protein
MQVIVTGRHITITDKLKDYVQEKLERFSRLGSIKKAEVILKGEEERFSVEIIFSLARGNLFVGSATDKDMYSALDTVIDKIEKQLTRFKDKLKSRKTRGIKMSKTILGDSDKEKLLFEPGGLSDLWW